MSDLVVDERNCKLVVATNSYGMKSAPYLDSNVTISAATETILVSIKNIGTYTVRVGTLSFSTDGNKAVKIRIYRNALTNGTFVLHPNCKCGAISTNGTLNYTMDTSTGISIRLEQHWGTVLAKVDTLRLNILDNDIPIILNPNDIITITAESSNSSDIGFSLRFKTKDR